MEMDSKQARMVFQIIIPFVLYLTLLICGLIVSICMALAKGSFDGNCPLYMEFNYFQSLYHFGKESTCNFVIYFPVIGLVIYPFIMCAIYVYIFVRELMGNEKAVEVIKKLIVAGLNAVIFILLLVTACIISRGRAVMCSNYEEVYRASSCYHLEAKKDWPDSRYQTNKLVRHIVSAEVTAWICHIWLVMLITPTVIEIWRKYRTPSPA